MPLGDVLWELGRISTPVVLLVTLIAGIAAGMGLAYLHPAPTSRTVRRAVLQGIIVAWLGAVFFVGRALVLTVEGDPLASRSAAVGVLWLLFAFGVGLGSWGWYRGTCR